MALVGGKTLADIARLTALIRRAAARDPYVRSPEMPGFPVCQFCLSVLGRPHTEECWWRQCGEFIASNP